MEITLQAVFAQGLLGCGEGSGPCWVPSVGFFPFTSAIQNSDQFLALLL